MLSVSSGGIQRGWKDSVQDMSCKYLQFRKVWGLSRLSCELGLSSGGVCGAVCLPCWVQVKQILHGPTFALRRVQRRVVLGHCQLNYMHPMPTGDGWEWERRYIRAGGLCHVRRWHLLCKRERIPVHTLLTRDILGSK